MRAIELLLRRALFFLPPDRVEAIVRPKRWRKRWQRLTREPLGARRMSPETKKPANFQNEERMRKGQNPAKFVSTVSKPERITAAVLSYVPFLSGYYAEVSGGAPGLPGLHAEGRGTCHLTRWSLTTARAAKSREYLLAEHEAGRIQYLVLSEHNVGKGGAWNMILGGAPGEILAYCDSDVLFSPNWLQRSVETSGDLSERRHGHRTPIPNAAGALLCHRCNGAGTQATVANGEFIPWETFLEFNLSLGQTEEENRRVYAETSDWKIAYNGAGGTGRRLALAVHRMEAHPAAIPAV